MGTKGMSARRRRTGEAPDGVLSPIAAVPAVSATSTVSDGSDIGSLYRRHVPDVSRWARRFGVGDADIEDVVHDVFLVAFRKLPAFDPARAAFGTWLFGVTARVVQARRRRELWRRRIRRACPWWNDDASAREPVVDDGAADGDWVAGSAANVLLGRLLDEIGEKYRTAIVMFEIEGLSCEEIAMALGCSIENVYVRVHRGRKKLAKALERDRERERMRRQGRATLAEASND